MATTSSTTSINTTSMFLTPQAVDDTFNLSENDLTAASSSGTYWTQSGSVFTFNVMANDAGGNAKTLWSLTDQEEGVAVTYEADEKADLISSDVGSVAESTAAILNGSATSGATIKIVSGKIVYDMSSIAGLINGLAAGETYTDTITYAIRLGNGTLSLAEMKVVLTGTNDGPTIVSATTDAIGGVTEDAATPTLSDTGTIAFNDLDLTDEHTTSVTADAGNTLGGTLTMGAVSEAADTEGGTVGWTYNVANSATQYLGEGETATEKFTVTIDDGNGGTVDQVVTVTITGTNDGPTIVSATTDATGGATEDAATPTLSDTGTIAFNDLDLTDEHTTSVTADAGNTLGGTLTMGAVSEAADTEGGTVGWTYNVANSATQYLGEGETATEKFTVTIDDGNGGTVDQVVTAIVTGVNDDATITAGDEDDNAVTEAGNGVIGDPDAGGKLVISDADQNQSLLDDASTGEQAGTYGTFTVAADGTWSYVLDDSAADKLAAGVDKTDTITVTSFDGTDTYDITVTIHGTNDAPVITTATSTYSIDENATDLIADFDASDVDMVDTADTLAWSLEGADAAAFSIDADGKLSLTAAQDYETDNQLSVTVKVSDGNGGSATKDITVNINDVNEVVYVTNPTGNTTVAPVTGDAKDNADNNQDNDAVGSSVTTTASNSLGNTIGGTSGADNLDGKGGDDTIYGKAGNDVLQGGVDNDTLYGQVDADKIDGGSGNDSIYGGSGNDTPLNGGIGDDTIYGGSGDDTIDGGNNDDLVYGGSGNDSILGAQNNDVLYGGSGTDKIEGAGGADKIYGDEGNDSPLDGGSGNDTIYGGSGNDTLVGGDGSDTLVGGYGADNLTGNGGADTLGDTFVFAGLLDGGDTITDFQSGVDKIDVTSLGFTSFSTTESATHGLWQVGNTVYGDTDGNVNTYEFTFTVNTTLADTDFIGI